MRYHDLHARAQAAGIELLGHQTDVGEILGSADVLAFTSAPPGRAPRVLIEAAMCSVAIVTTDVPGARDVVLNEVSGFIVPVDDADTLLATSELLQQPSLRRRMGGAGHAHAIAQFDLRTTLSAWNELLAGVSKRG